MELSHSREFQFPMPTQLRLQSHFGESGNFSLDRAILGGSPAPAVAPSISEPRAQLGEDRTGVGMGKVCCAAAIGTALAKGYLWGHRHWVLLGSEGAAWWDARVAQDPGWHCCGLLPFTPQPLAGIAHSHDPMGWCKEEQRKSAWETSQAESPSKWLANSECHCDRHLPHRDHFPGQRDRKGSLGQKSLCKITFLPGPGGNCLGSAPWAGFLQCNST